MGVFKPSSMLFQITDIKFDFTGCVETHGSYELPEDEQKEVLDSVIGSFWEADDEDDLVDEISNGTGWLIESLDFVHVLS